MVDVAVHCLEQYQTKEPELSGAVVLETKADLLTGASTRGVSVTADPTAAARDTARARASLGSPDQVDNQIYHERIVEEVRPWSYMKFPFIKQIGPEKGWYRVGPLARLNTCDFIDTPQAEKARQTLFARFDEGFQRTTGTHRRFPLVWLDEDVHLPEVNVVGLHAFQ